MFKKYNLVNYNELFEDPHDTSQHSSYMQSDYSHDTDTLVAGPRNRRSFKAQRMHDPVVVGNLLSSRPNGEQHDVTPMLKANTDPRTWSVAGKARNPMNGVDELEDKRAMDPTIESKSKQAPSLSAEERDRQLLFDCEPKNPFAPVDKKPLTSSQREDALSQLMEPYNKSDSDQSDEVDEEAGKDQPVNGTL